MSEITRGSGNVLVDLGFGDAEELTTKVQLAMAINDIAKRRRLKQTDLAGLLGVSQPKVSALANYKLEGFSVGRLMSFLVALGRDIEIRVTKAPRSRKQGRVKVAAVV